MHSIGHIRYIFKCLYLESSGNDIFCSSLNIGWTNFEVTLEMYEECSVLNIFLGAMPTKSLKTTGLILQVWHSNPGCTVTVKPWEMPFLIPLCPFLFLQNKKHTCLLSLILRNVLRSYEIMN